MPNNPLRPTPENQYRVPKVGELKARKAAMQARRAAMVEKVADPTFQERQRFAEEQRVKDEAARKEHFKASRTSALRSELVSIQARLDDLARELDDVVPFVADVLLTGPLVAPSPAADPKKRAAR